MSPLGDAAFIASKTAGGDATLDFTSGIDGTYLSYEVRFHNLIPVTNGVTLYLQVSTDVGATFKSAGTDYRSANSGFNGAGTSSAANGNEAGIVIMSSANGQRNAATSGLTGAVVFSGHNSTTDLFKAVGQIVCEEATTTDVFRQDIAGRYQTAGTPINAIRITYNTGGIASGTVTLAGKRKA
jgi:hypothetical protein